MSKPAAGGKRHAIKPPPVEAGGRFFARDPAGAEHELKLHKLAVDVTTQPGTVRSHLSMEVATPNDGQSEAIIRLPVPRGAAVTDAVLWVNDKPMRGAFVERQRARGIYTSIVTRRRDPALVDLGRPGLDRGVDLSAGEEPAAPLRAGLGRARGRWPTAASSTGCRSSRSATGSSAARRSRSTAASWRATRAI